MNINTIVIRCSGRPLDAWGYVAKRRWEKLRLGLKYGLGRLTREEASSLLYDIEIAAGVAVLCSIDVEGTLRTAIEDHDFEPHPALEGYIADGVALVRSKWSGNGDVVCEAEGWAIDKAMEYAAEDGLVFHQNNNDDCDCASCTQANEAYAAWKAVQEQL